MLHPSIGDSKKSLSIFSWFIFLSAGETEQRLRVLVHVVKELNGGYSDSLVGTTLQGLWGGMIGGTLIQTLILIWITLRTDWDKEVSEPPLMIIVLSVTNRGRLADKWSSHWQIYPTSSTRSYLGYVMRHFRAIILTRFMLVWSFGVLTGPLCIYH
jgi:hypothetical protein